MTGLRQIPRMAYDIATDAGSLYGETNEENVECGVMRIHEDATTLVWFVDGLILGDLLAPADSRQDRTP